MSTTVVTTTITSTSTIMNGSGNRLPPSSSTTTMSGKLSTIGSSSKSVLPLSTIPKTPDVSRAKLKKFTAKTPSSSKGILASPDSAPVLPDRAPEAMASTSTPSNNKRPTRVRSSVFRAAEHGRKDVLPVLTPISSKPKNLVSMRPRRNTTNSIVSRSFSGEATLRPSTSIPLGGNMTRVTSSDQLPVSKSLRARRTRSSNSRLSARGDSMNNSQNSSFGALNDSNSCISSDERSMELDLMMEPEEPSPSKYEVQRNHSKSRLPIYSDDMDHDSMSLGASKKQFSIRSSYSTNTRQFSFIPSFFFSVNSIRRYRPKELWHHLRKPQVMTLLVLLAITCFVASSYHQVMAATERIEDIRDGESKLLVHMHKVEQQALEFAENLKRLDDQRDAGESNQADRDVLRVRIEKLRDMEAELDHEVKTLRKSIQLSARQSLIENYGEGAIQVFLDIKESESTTIQTISLRLWYDTPHTAWTFLQQIKAGVWNGANFSIQQGRALVAEPEGGTRVRPNLDFVESSERGHERYTITLMDTGLSINLQDNRNQYRQEACVGVIFEGFDVLHQVVKEAQSGDVKIVQARAQHMTSPGY